LDLNEVAREVIQQAVPFALNKQIDLGFEESLVSAKVRGDLLSLQEMILNLIDNAIRYTQLGGKVTLKISVDHAVHLLVEDNGPGIPDEERDHVFERFYRVLGAKVEGSGLGLAIVQEIAEVHSAKVSLSSGHNGQGTLVDVEF